jgi:hypothetical protein
MLAARFTKSHSSLDFWSFLSMSGHTRDRNKLFAHLRDTNHFMASEDSTQADITDPETLPDTPTPNDPSQETDPEVV